MRRSQRSLLLSEIQQKSGSLRFQTGKHRNAVGWARDVRSLLNLRGRTFEDEAAAVVVWLWNSTDTTLPARLRLWRSALTENTYQDVDAAVRCHAKWWKRLREADEAVRVRLATLLAEDTVTMYFLRFGRGINDEAAWQPVTTGSAGQRSAAMALLYAIDGVYGARRAVSCDCLAHRHGNAADRPVRQRAYPTDMSDAEWAQVAPMVPVPAWMGGRGGRPEGYCHREMLGALIGGASKISPDIRALTLCARPA